MQVEGDPVLSGFCCCVIPLIGAAALGFVAFKLLGGGRNRRRRDW
ncbi:hypothetical protein [Alienimonas californiensis]|uniref:Uncharacterized protein n=1 Tax=Alienimonas californiensis TaxID=2527989 RepID=A0A517P7B8_9PLAN|nr:hypothetical protein [Alienimonas californiensis]QDT15267.1 hypothetical protein CA12_13500 [Alienimonas californiensis]